MRRKVICTAHTRAGEVTALLLAQLDLTELVVLGDGAAALAGDLQAAAAAQRYEPRVAAGGWPEAAGAELVVLDAVDDATAGELAVRCSSAVIVVATPTAEHDVAQLLEGSRLPRARIVGVDGGGGPITSAAAAVRVADAVLRDRRAPLRCAVLCRDDGGQDGVRLRDVTVGASGVQAIL